MKKNALVKIGFIFIILVSGYFLNVDDKNQTQKQVVSLGVCVDGDTVRLREDGKEKKYRMLLIDTPESTKEIEPYGLEAAQFTCQALENAKRIEISYQKGNDSKDKYGRDLVWIFVDGELLQTKIAKAGYLKKLYDNGGPFDYKNEIIEADLWAKEHKMGQYKEN